MTEDRDSFVSLPIKEFVDREIKHLKEQVYVELDARAKALELAHRNDVWLIGTVITVIGILTVIAVHFWK